MMGRAHAERTKMFILDMTDVYGIDASHILLAYLLTSYLLPLTS